MLAESHGRYEVRRSSLDPELFVMVWVEGNVTIQTTHEMTEVELRGELLREGRSDEEIDQVVEDARAA